MSRNHRVSGTWLTALLTAVVVAGCAQRPVLYPNGQYSYVGAASADAEVTDCMNLAEAHAAHSSRLADTAKSTGIGAAIGAGTGAAIGALGGGAGTGAAIGAIGGAAGGLLRSAFRSNEPDPVYRRFVERCLRDRGYEPIGWQ